MAHIITYILGIVSGLSVNIIWLKIKKYFQPKHAYFNAKMNTANKSIQIDGLLPATEQTTSVVNTLQSTMIKTKNKKIG